MYEDYFGFAEKPFSLTPDPKYLFKSATHASAFELLQYAVRRREGFVVITGGIGTGKTTLCRALLDQVDRRTFTALILNPFVSEDDLLRLILQDFGVVSRREVARGRLAGVSKQDLIQTLNEFLLSLLPLGAGAMLIVDEAQNLPLQVLEQLRILSNLETEKEKLLQIVLVGQPNLKDLLRTPTLRQLDQRVSIRYDLAPLTREETGAYVMHRLAIAGGSGVTFSSRAMDAVYRCTGGVPRLINLVADRALLGGYSARTAAIQPAHVWRAAESLELTPPRRRLFTWVRQRAAAFAAGASVASLFAVAAPLTWQPRLSAGPAPVVAVAPATPHADVVLPQESSSSTTHAIATTGSPEAPKANAATAARPAAAVPMPARPYWVLVASFRTQGEADSLVADLQSQGFGSRISHVTSPTSGRWLQVLAGPFAELPAAQQAEARLREAPAYADAHVTRR